MKLWVPLCLVFALVATKAKAGVISDLPEDQVEQVLALYHQHCGEPGSSPGGGYGGGGYAPPSSNSYGPPSSQDPKVNIVCKEPREYPSNPNDKKVIRVPPQYNPIKKQVIFVEVPVTHFKHDITLLSEPQQGQKTKIFVLPQKSDHTINVEDQRSYGPGAKPQVFFLKGNGDNSEGYPLPPQQPSYGPPSANPPPSSGYGPPPQQSPPSEYGPPAQSPAPSNYRPPAQSQPPSNYGPPAQNPPQSSYGPPAQSPPPSNYGPPAQSPPPSNYGPRAQNPPQSSYGPPAQQSPPSNYGPPPQKPPPSSYGPPSQNPPSSNYGPPPQNPPASNYGPPSYTLPPGYIEQPTYQEPSSLKLNYILPATSTVSPFKSSGYDTSSNSLTSSSDSLTDLLKKFAERMRSYPRRHAPSPPKTTANRYPNPRFLFPSESRVTPIVFGRAKAVLGSRISSRPKDTSKFSSKFTFPIKKLNIMKAQEVKVANSTTRLVESPTVKPGGSDLNHPFSFIPFGNSQQVTTPVTRYGAKPYVASHTSTGVQAVAVQNNDGEEEQPIFDVLPATYLGYSYILDRGNNTPSSNLFHSSK